MSESRLDRALGLIEAQHGRRPGPAEAAAKTAIDTAMGAEKRHDPDPYPAELRHALIIGDEEACDWLAHTAEGKRLYRRRAQWLGGMRRRRGRFRNRLFVATAGLLPAPVASGIVRAVVTTAAFVLAPDGFGGQERALARDEPRTAILNQL